MATKEQVTRVWIEEGCIVCDACETAAPDVFEVQEETCIIRPEALTAEFTKPRTEAIIDAAEECPVDVIKYETVMQEVPEELREASPAAEHTEATGTKAEAAAGSQPQEEPVSVAAGPIASGKSPDEATAPVPAAGKKKEASPAKAPSVPDPDPAITELLRAATARGGNAAIVRKQTHVPDSVRGWEKKDPKELPPEARHAKVLEAARKARKDPDAERRAFLSNTALAIGWSVFGVGAGISVGPAFGRFMMPNVLEEPDPRVRVGKLQRYKEMAPGEVIEDYKPQGIWLIREGDRLAALSIICTHLGCIPNWLPNDRKFKCPCHGSGYKPNGINFEGPTPRPLERFRIFVEDGIVVVDKSKKYQYELGQWDQPGSYIEV